MVPGSVALASADTQKCRGSETTAGLVGLAAVHAPPHNCRSWLLDTGCKYDLTSRGSVPEHELSMIMPAPTPITLSTDNNLVDGDHVVRQQIGEFSEIAEPYLLEARCPLYRT